MRRNAIIAAAALATISPRGLAHAQVNQHGYTVPLQLTLEAAQEALRSCSANGYDVTVTVVDVSGIPQVILRGDHSTIHTRDSSFRKAYTIVTVGPLFKLQASAEIAQHNPAAVQLATLPNIIALPGAVAVVAHGEIVAGLGVAGSLGVIRTKLARRLVLRCENQESVAAIGVEGSRATVVQIRHAARPPRFIRTDNKLARGANFRM